MSLEYQKVWETMNSLETTICKAISVRQVIDAAVEALERGDREKAENLMNASYDFIGYFVDDFDKKFKSAWNETVVKLKNEKQEILNKDWESFYYPEEVKEKDIMPPWGHSDMEALQYTEEILNAMCDQAEKDQVKKWTLPVEIDGASGEYFLTLPDDLLDKLLWSEGDTLEWIDNKNGTLTLCRCLDKIGSWES